jgi:hypothetical protein
VRLAVLPLMFVLGVAVAACGGHAVSEQRATTLQSAITRVSGTRTIVQTITSHVPTDARPTPAQDDRTAAQLVRTGYFVCRHVPGALVRSARTDGAARRQLARIVLQQLAAHGSRRERPLLLAGCLRALKLKALPTATA